MRYVTIASVLFQTEAKLGRERQTNATTMVLEETERVMKSLGGYQTDLAVFSEGIEFYGQTIDDAEEVGKPGPFLGKYMGFARSARCYVIGSVKLREGANVYNSLVYVAPEGRVLDVYHKMFLNISEIEEGIQSGHRAVVVDTPIGRLGGILCMDINIAAARQQYAALKPDILAFSSLYHGGLQQQEWAYRCRSFFVSSFHFHGCGILDPFGQPVKLTDEYNSVARARVNLDRAMVHLDFNREKFSDIGRKYSDEVLIDIPPNIGTALIYSCTEKRSAMDVVREFELELVDDYFERTIRANAANRRSNHRNRPASFLEARERASSP